MNVDLNEFTLRIDCLLVAPTSPNFRPLTWPPADDWPVVINKDGAVVSRWGDPEWDLSPWHGKPAILDFGDGKAGKAPRVDAENARILRMIATWLIWGPRAPRSVGTVKASFWHIRQVVSLCSVNGVSAANLMRFPKVLESVPDVLPASKYGATISLLHRLYDARAVLGFTILDPRGLSKLAAAARDHDVVQTPYIPPRIWAYQVNRLHECVTDFLAHRKQVEACFMFCLRAYVGNYGSLKAAVTPRKDPGRAPFNSNGAFRAGQTYHGQFSEIAIRYGIVDLMRKWISWEQDGMHVWTLSAYMSLVTYAALAYVANFTLQRKEEVASLRASCLLWEEDEKLGRVPIICGETTKTDPDSDARWVASPSVDKAIEAASIVARLRMLCDRENPILHPSESDQADPYLSSAANEPWGRGVGQVRFPYSVRQPILDLGKAMRDRYPMLFEPDQLWITAEDLELALRLTPNLPEAEFAVGELWPLAWHQYRRTGCVNMFASGVISDSSMQQQMKHSSRLMPLYYGRNHSRLRLNEDVQGAVVTAMYEAQAERLMGAVLTDRFVSPHSPEGKVALVVNVLNAKDVKDLAAMAKRGTINFREHRLGGCMKAGACEYGGVESVARCAGGDGAKPCTEVLYDRAKAPQVSADLRRVVTELNTLPTGHPRCIALNEERRAMENFVNVV
jgi:hypothetical protein